MFLTMMRGCQQEVLAARAALFDERCKAQPDPTRIKALEACERRALETAILGQIWWGPYWAVADFWWGRNADDPSASGPNDLGDRPRPGTSTPPMLMAAE